MSGVPSGGSDEALVQAVALALTGEALAGGALTGGALTGGALTGEASRGETLPADPASGLTPDDVVTRLARAGWDAVRVQQHRQARQQAGETWPHPVVREVLAAAGFARFGAMLKQARTLLAADGLVPTRHVGPKVLGPAERRLLAERPPHHG